MQHTITFVMLLLFLCAWIISGYSYFAVHCGFSVQLTAHDNPDPVSTNSGRVHMKYLPLTKKNHFKEGLLCLTDGVHMKYLPLTEKKHFKEGLLCLTDVQRTLPTLKALDPLL